MSRTPLIDVAHLTPDTASPASADLLLSAKARTGFLPNMYGFMAQHPAILGGYLASYDAFRTDSGFAPAEQEVVFLTISRTNGCTYCMAAHSMIADKRSGVPADALAALRAGDPLPDARLNALSVFAQAMVEKRGRVDRTDLDAFLAEGFTQDQVLAIIIAIAAKTFSNYVNHLTDPDVDGVFEPYRMG